MPNAQGILDAKDRKQVSGIEYINIRDINIDLLLDCTQEALILD